MLLCTALTHSCMRRSESACRRQDLDQRGMEKREGSEAWGVKWQDGQADIQRVCSWYQSYGNTSAPIGNILLDMPLCPILSPQIKYQRVNIWGSTRGLQDPCQPVRLRHTGHHPGALYSLAGGHDLKAEPSF